LTSPNKCVSSYGLRPPPKFLPLAKTSDTPNSLYEIPPAAETIYKLLSKISNMMLRGIQKNEKNK